MNSGADWHGGATLRVLAPAAAPSDNYSPTIPVAGSTLGPATTTSSGGQGSINRAWTGKNCCR